MVRISTAPTFDRDNLMLPPAEPAVLTARWPALLLFEACSKRNQRLQRSSAIFGLRPLQLSNKIGRFGANCAANLPTHTRKMARFLALFGHCDRPRLPARHCASCGPSLPIISNYGASGRSTNSCYCPLAARSPIAARCARRSHRCRRIAVATPGGRPHPLRRLRALRDPDDRSTLRDGSR